MSRDDYPSPNQATFTPDYSTEWTSMSILSLTSQQAHAPAESTVWSQFLAPALSGGDPDIMAEVSTQRFNGLNLNAVIPAEHPGATGLVGDYSQHFTTYMYPVNPNTIEKFDSTPTTDQVSSCLGIDAIGTSSSFDGGDSAPQSIASTPTSNSGWTKEQDKLLMSLKTQGLGYSAIQDEMRKAFGWTRNKNVLVKRSAVWKKRCKPQIKTRIVRDISKKIAPEIIAAVGAELEKVTSSGSNSIAAELEDLVPLKLPEFLKRLVADVGVSLHQIVEQDKRPSA